MSALEQEIIQKIKNLDGEKKLRVLEFIRVLKQNPKGRWASGWNKPPHFV